MDWFRMYREFSTDPKVQMMNEVYQRRLVMLMCLRCGNDSETFHDEQIAFQLRVSIDEWQHTKDEFLARGFIDKKNNLRNWDKRQYRSDSSTERVRAHRERKRNAKKQLCNVSETPSDTDTDTDTDTKLVESAGTLTPTPKGKDNGQSKNRRATRLDEHWRCSEALARQIQEKFNLLADEVKRQEQIFRDYWAAESGAKARKRDWNAAFRVWCSRADPRHTQGISGSGSRGGGSQGAVQLAEKFEEAAVRRQGMGDGAVDLLEG